MITVQHVQRDAAPTVAVINNDGHGIAWDEVLLRYGALVSTTVRSFRLQDADALDAVQTTWLRLAEHAHQVQWSERLAGWLVTTARRECLRILRQAKRISGPVDTMTETFVDESVGPEQNLIDVDMRQKLWRLVDELSPRQRALLQALFTDDPRPYVEIADTLGIPTGAIGPTRARALQQLRRRLNEHGLGPAA
ncbi:MAG: RNA polymerase sigma factor [Pseudonocardiaceae bacterium]